MYLRQITYFLKVAEYGNFTRAAAALHVSQPALSQQVRMLEESLGVPLFDRSGRNIRLTDAGEVYRHYAQRAVLELDGGRRALQDLRELNTGTLRVAVAPTLNAYLTGPLLEHFYHEHAGIHINLQVMAQEQIERHLNEDLIDLGLAYSETMNPNLTLTPLLIEKLALVANSAHPLAQSEQVCTEQLAATELALLSHSFTTRICIDDHFKMLSAAPRVAMEANSISTLIELLQRTSLASLLPTAVADRYTDLTSISLTPAPQPRQVMFMQRTGAYQNLASAAFISEAQRLLGTDVQT